MVRSPGLQMYSDAGSMYNKMLFRFMKLMSHKIPGQMMDLASKITGQKPQVGGVYERLDNIMDGCEHPLLFLGTALSDSL